MQNFLKLLRNDIDDVHKKPAARFFKTGSGCYAEHDLFLNIPVPILRKLVKETTFFSLTELECLITSPYNEERLIALLFLIHYVQKKHINIEEAYNFYVRHLMYVNNWNLVDQSAPYISGVFCMQKNNVDILFEWAKSDVMWIRRIAIVSCLAFIRCNKLDITFDIAKILLNDSHDLIHKATGWMLREAGKKDEQRLIDFLDEHSHKMPRTMYRYAIERLKKFAC